MSEEHYWTLLLYRCSISKFTTVIQEKKSLSLPEVSVLRLYISRRFKYIYFSLYIYQPSSFFRITLIFSSRLVFKRCRRNYSKGVWRLGECYKFKFRKNIRLFSSHCGVRKVLLGVKYSPFWRYYFYNGNQKWMTFAIRSKHTQA